MFSERKIIFSGSLTLPSTKLLAFSLHQFTILVVDGAARLFLGLEPAAFPLLFP